MSLACPRDGIPMRIREFFMEGAFMVLDCPMCKRTQIYDVNKEMNVASSRQKIFLRNKLFEFYEKLRGEKIGAR